MFRIAVLAFVLCCVAAGAQEEARAPNLFQPSEDERTAAQLSVAERAGAVFSGAEVIDWAGRWHSFWRGGQALLTLEQNGPYITGSYQPGDGRIEGRQQGLIVSGDWRQAGASGRFEFAMAPDGQSFVGRFGNGEYWNGVRLAAGAEGRGGFGQATPRAAFASLVTAINSARGGDSFAELELRDYLDVEDAETSLRDINARVALLSEIINAAHFRILDAPEAGRDGLGAMWLRLDGTAWRMRLDFNETAPGVWKIRLPERDRLEAEAEAALAATGMQDFDALAAARRQSPRQTLRDFVAGTERWHQDGKELALATLDMSRIPESLRSVDGPLAAEYLRQIMDRLGRPIWQELPDDPERRQPHLLYENAAGEVVIAYDETEEGTGRWRFSADTLAAAPMIYEALQNLPAAAGVSPTPPLTRAFRIRSALADLSPTLLQRGFGLENWQWMAIAVALAVSVLGSWIVMRAARLVAIGVLSLCRAAPETRGYVVRAFSWPARVFAAGALLAVLLRQIGLRQDVSTVTNGMASGLLILGGTYFAYYLVDAVTASLARTASKTQTQIDDVAILIGGGLVKIAVIVLGIVLGAELLGLPYEGVIAALGVGGLALGIAARDAVSNFIGAGMLMTDRSFRKGDLIETGGQVGIVEEVGLRSTRLRTLDDALLVVPNNKISEEQVNNWGRMRHHRVQLTLCLTYDMTRQQLDGFVEGLKRVFAAQPAGMPGVHVGLSGIGVGSVDVLLIGSFDTPDFAAYMAARHRLIGDIVELAAELEIEFALPEEVTEPTEPQARASPPPPYSKGEAAA